VDPEQPRFGHEVNLFTDRSRSMLVLLYGPRVGETGLRWWLDAVAAVPFRCSQRNGREDPPRPSAAAWEPLLAEQEGWSGQLERLEPHRWPEGDPEPRPCEPFRASAFATQPITAGFADGLVCSVPELLPAAGFTLQVGCRLGPDRFHQVSLVFDAEQRLRAWELRRYRRP
jgi:hypothetical protein